MSQSDQFTGPTSSNPGKIELLKRYLDYTHDAAGIDESLPADEETAYSLGANHAFYDTLCILHEGAVEPSDESHVLRNVLVVGGSLVAGAALYDVYLTNAWRFRELKKKISDVNARVLQVLSS